MNKLIYRINLIKVFIVQTNLFRSETIYGMRLRIGTGTSSNLNWVKEALGLSTKHYRYQQAWILQLS